MNKTEIFYRDILPPIGNYYLAVAKNGKITQRSYGDIETFIAAITLLSETNNNVYFGTANFGASRTIQDANEKKCYYLDIDYGSGTKIYRTAKDTTDAIKHFVDSGDLPSPSYIVSTGHGFHLYWVLEEPIPKMQWLIGANNLKRFCIDNELHADHGITGDVARILRAPGSLNVKDPDDPKKVTLSPKYTEDILKHPTDLFAQGAGMFPELGKLIGPDDLSAMPLTESSYTAKNIITKCSIMKRSFAEHGANDTGEVWGNNLLILTFTEDGEKLKHRMGDAHPDYSEASTDAKWRVKQQCGAKPTTCAFMAGLPDCGSLCAACPVKGTVTSPLHLGKIEPEPVQVAPAVAAAQQTLSLPDDYVQNNSGLWRRTGEDEDGRPKFEPVLPPSNNKSVIDMVVSKDTAYHHHYQLKMHADEPFDIQFAGKCLSEGQTWDRLLAEKRMPLNEPFKKRFRSFIVSWIGQLSDQAVKYGQTHFGWAEDHGAFAVGDEVYKDGNTYRNDMADRVMQSKYSNVGNFEDWKKKANLVINDRPASAVIVAASLAAPLIGFTRDPGCVLSIHGDSGTGKTTVMKIAQTLWGHPIKAMMSLDDTALSMLNSMGVMKNLPAFWDEVRGTNADERLMQTVFRLTAGRERSRLTQSVEQREVHEWQTILITSSNISALGTIASQTKDSDAGIMRFFELSMPTIINKLPDLNVSQCYGGAGRIYGEYLAANHDKVRAQVEKAELSIRAALQAEEPERFRVSLVASLIAGAQIGNELLGLDFDIESLVSYLRMEFIKLRASSEQHRDAYSPEALLVQFINDMSPHRLLTNRCAGRGKVQVTAMSFPKNNMPVYVQLAQTGECLVDKPRFDEWVEAKVGLKSHKTKEEMLKVAGITITQRPIGGGTSYSTPRGYIYHIDLTNTAWNGVFDSLYQPLAQAGNVTPISS